ncbi:hypothetical protein [Bradyrhizobium japonicum]|uniref:hypothetical protein n=1 Tax=Bradyrhizobium japonicum TaxID=375 RepID=UPI002714BE34|nr:hypothetical protein [Bradyrhizobium japonicum]WLB58017.1 hypothetical protein QIH94_19110 [Bradyrhizobium japonicum]WLB60116.1 hypothetical protein QIH96_26830 [Bradyrhizobium japonicum]
MKFTPQAHMKMARIVLRAVKAATETKKLRLETRSIGCAPSTSPMTRKPLPALLIFASMVALVVAFRFLAQ